MEENKKRSEDDVESEKIAPTLLKMERHNPFEVPEGYFETLPHIIQEKCVAISNKRSLWEIVYNYVRRPQLVLATICASLLMVFSLHHYKNTSHINPKEDVLVGYYLNELDENALEDVVVINQSESDADKDADAAYLIEHNIDPSQITE